MSRSRVAEVFANEWPVLVATLTRDLGDLSLAEESAQDAFTEAAARWGPDTTPTKPGAWLLTTARRKAIDTIRRGRRFNDRLPALLQLAETPQPEPAKLIDDQLALIFGCCHPSLNHEARIALTLRQVCGLSTNQIGEAFLVPTATMAKRLVRAKKKIRAAGVPFKVPEPAQLADRVDDVLAIIYLIFTEGHTSSDGANLLRGDLCDEARWLASVLIDLLVGHGAQPGPSADLSDLEHDAIAGRAETMGLYALMSFTDSRRSTRTNSSGDLVLLDDQDRSQWDRQLIADGQSMLASAMTLGHVGPYQLQAAIAGIHAQSQDWSCTDWLTIVELYDNLEKLAPSPVVSLNRAAAVAMAEEPSVGLALIDELVESGELDDYRYLHAGRADLLRRLGRHDEATTAYRRAIECSSNDAELAFLRQRITEISRSNIPSQR